jgi:hypothetical protein
MIEKIKSVLDPLRLRFNDFQYLGTWTERVS